MTSGVRWLSVGPGSGYGDAGVAYARDCGPSGSQSAGHPSDGRHRHGMPPTGRSGPRTARAFAQQEIADEAIEHDTVVVHSPPLWHARLLEEADGRLLVACTTWETDRLPPDWVDTLNRYDRVLVPSRFNAAVFKRCGVQPPVRRCLTSSGALPDPGCDVVAATGSSST